MAEEHVDLELVNDPPMEFAGAGEAKTVILKSSLRLIHGTEDHLRSIVTSFLKEEYYVNPEKYDPETKEGSGFLKHSYYIALQALETEEVDCAIRLTLDNMETPSTMVIDYLRTKDEQQEKGLASQIIQFLLRGCRESNTKVFVSSPEEAVDFWEGKFGFVQEFDESLQMSLNNFGNTKTRTLMGLFSNALLDSRQS